MSTSADVANKTHSHLKRRFGWAWAAPDLDQHNPSLVASLLALADPVYGRAWEVVQQGPRAITATLASADEKLIALLLDVQQNYMPPSGLVSRLRKSRARREGRQLTGGELAGDIWPDKEVVLSVPIADGPLNGKWPSKPGHTCKHNWHAEEIAENQWAISHWTGRAWRGGLCNGCYYDRVMTLCKQIEWETEQADDAGRVKWIAVASGNFASLNKRFRNHRSRKGTDVRYIALPQYDNTYFVVHTDPDEGGEPIPLERAELFELLDANADTHPDRRVSSSEGWGGPWSGMKGDGRSRKKPGKRGGEESKDNSETQAGKKGSVSFIGQGIGRLLSWANQLGYETDPRGRKVHLQATKEQLIELLELGGFKYHAIRGWEEVAAIKRGLKQDESYKGQMISNDQEDMSLMRLKEEPPPLSPALFGPAEGGGWS